ncbi:MAG: threonine--tRNA ligase [Candidatus Doudnabacteria bacterium RIFCSPHIGHO2_12_FULL_48_11]|uniref:Threonine--tRNA ligase n=1 Tax=Candidatus Doudnabacteria bacterium RIFCSPHIGHO2_01_FULL_46_24 TaxID=1817825 RepID=A0A1F5NW80_9BACT|nr:MAG: threonine--tRNA ligase [Candidatus Doudnabacteria bacterium RIFCSPHIGHO2_01_FULL_46_24]OGE95361.1 MAG: threonine--tRNA ligase [Candidatus Doudnabacteria bacterium RIFCSPHIGHO2_12_FULL_48_11]
MTKQSQEYLDNLRHSCAHLLAAAVMQLWPNAKRAIGPSIENGFYFDFDFGKDKISEKDFGRIEKKMREIAPTWDGFKRHELPKEAAKKEYPGNPYKHELIDEFASKGEKLSFYKSGNYWDLCRGGHIDNPKKELQHFKLLSVAGAYWRGSEKNPMLTRIYATCWPSQKELDDYLKMREEAEKRDHRILGEKLGIFTFAEEVGMGLPLWLPKGTIIREELEAWAKETEKQWGYQRVATPHITKEELYKISGHLPYYAEDMYSPIDIEGAKYYLKPMNCPHHHMIYKSKIHSYRELPLRLTEYGQLYRFEQSGALHGLMRVRGFCQNDAHIYLAEKDVPGEFARVMEMHKYYYDRLGIKNFKIKLGLRDPKNLRKKYHGDDAMWKRAEKLTREGLEKSKVKFEEDIGSAAHYGPKGDVIIESVIGKEYAIGTVQVDLYMPSRFGLYFVNERGEHEQSAIIHRAPLGSHERMVGFLIEHFAGAFPVWLSPVQVAVLPISDKQVKYAQKVVDELVKNNIRVDFYNRPESIGKKIREAEIQKIPYMLIIGEKEQRAKSIAVRARNNKNLGVMKLDRFVDRVLKEIKTKKI